MSLISSGPQPHIQDGAWLQQTLKARIGCAGIGLHSGRRVAMTLAPAPADTGIVFVRTDLKGSPRIAATFDRVVDTRLCTVLGAEGVTVGTVEHLMAAFAGAAIDNAVVELDGPEVPVMDGSAEPFLFLIECAGVVEQPAARRAIRMLKTVTVGEGDRSASLAPGFGSQVAFEIEFASAAIRRQSRSLHLGRGAFKAELARARTFGFVHEIEALRSAGLARGGSLDNAIVVAGDTVLNEGGLRYADEFVRHKMLDAVGDLYLAGAPIIGRYQGIRAGHALTNQLLRAVMADETAWCWATPESVSLGSADWSRQAAERVTA